MSGLVVGVEAGDRRPLAYDSNATGDAEADASIAGHRSLPVFGMVSNPSARRRYPSKFRRPTHLARRVAKLNRRRRSSYRWASDAQIIFSRKIDDDSRYRFASYELSTPEHSRRGRPSSPCPAAAGSKPRDDGLRVSSRLHPRSRLGAVTNLARGASAVILRPSQTDGVRAKPDSRQRTGHVASGALPAARSRDRRNTAVPAFCGCPVLGARVDRSAGQGRPSALVIHTNRGRSFAVTRHGRSTFLGVGSPTGGPALGRTRPEAGGRSASSRIAAPSRAAVVVKPRSLVDPASSHMLVSKIKPCMSQCKPH